ncbi:uncharacterized protein UTRI_04926 [Ustilago trichophora]|uniref:Uncharacterized protein n=1 Tax=Ustilago trichophora TaxID=86804 RepID=A0A5C3EH54_9BASI|nr:uncharacterized protein UTRI_04926 [Ustilago trichophora]
MTPRAARAAFKSVGIDTSVSASQVLARLPERAATPENDGEISFPHTPKNSRQLVALASQIRSSEHPNRESRLLWSKMIKAAGLFHDKSVLLQQEVAELHHTLAFRQVRQQGDQARLSQAKVLDSKEIHEAMQRKNAQKQAKKRGKRGKKRCLPSTDQESSPTPSISIWSSSSSSLDVQHSRAASVELDSASSGLEDLEEPRYPGYHDWYDDDCSDDEIDLL